jgi:hypothetical protein
MLEDNNLKKTFWQTHKRMILLLKICFLLLLFLLFAIGSITSIEVPVDQAI